MIYPCWCPLFDGKVFLWHTSLMTIAPAQMFMPYRQVLMSIAPAQDCSCHIHIGVHCSIPRVYATSTLMSIAPPQDCLCHTHIDVHCSIPRLFMPHQHWWPLLHPKIVYATPTLISIAPPQDCWCHTHTDPHCSTPRLFMPHPQWYYSSKIIHDLHDIFP